MKGKKIFLLLALVMVVFLIASCAPANVTPTATSTPTAPANVIKWKFSTHGPPTDAAANVMKWYVAEANKRTGGRMEIELFFTQTLLPSAEHPDGLKSGLTQMASLYTGYHPSKTPLLNLSTLPLLFPAQEVNETVYTNVSNIFNEWASLPAIKSELAGWDAQFAANFVPIWWSFMSKESITSIAEMQGKKVRCPSANADIIKAVGGAPVNMVAPEVYDALSKGTLDAVIIGVDLQRALRLYEISKYYDPSMNMGIAPLFVSMKKSAYDALPKDIQATLQQLNQESPAVIAKAFAPYMNESLKVFDDAGLKRVKFSDEDYKKMTELAKPMWKVTVDKLESENKPAKDTFNSLQQLMQKYIPGFTASKY